MKTRRFLGWVAMATMVLSTGCSNDEVVEDFSPENAIEFGTYLGKDAESRGLILTNDGLKEQGFGVFAYYTGQKTWTEYSQTEGIVPNFMNNEVVKYSDNTKKWTYSPIKYWPNNINDKVSFFAYAPYNEDYEVLGTTIHYTIPKDVTDHIDLTWNNSKNYDLTKQNVDGTVKFVFQHALSKIDFTVEAAVDEIDPENKKLAKGTKIVVNSVHLCGKDSKIDDFEYDGKVVAVAVMESIFTKSATLEMNNTTDVASWTSDEEYTAYSLYQSNFGVYELTDKNSSEAQLLTKDDSHLMIIPQTFDENGFYVFIDYDVITEDEKLPNGKITINNKIQKQVTGLNFESGKQYKLNLVLGMTSVKVEAKVADWVTADPTQVDLPKNNPNN